MYDAIAAQLLDDRVSAPPTALRAPALSVADIDSHVDRDRIWATIIAVRKLAFSEEFFDDLTNQAALRRPLEEEFETTALAKVAQGLYNFKRKGYREEDLDALFALIPEGYDIGA